MRKTTHNPSFRHRGAAIFAALRRELGATFHGNLISFGRVLSNMEGLRQKRSKLGKLYLVRRRQP